MPDITVPDLIRQEATKAGIPPDFALAVAEQESGFNPGAKSKKGAIGVMQLMPDTAKKYGADPTDPTQNIQAGVKHLRYLFDKYQGDPQKILTAYNAGEDRVGGALPAETQAYIPGVLNRIKKFQQAAASSTGAKQGAPAKPPAKSPQTPSKRTFGQDLAQTLYEGIPMLTGATGAMLTGAAGGALGAGLGPAGAVAGAGLAGTIGAGAGGMVGRRLQQYIRSLTNIGVLPKQPLPSSSQAIAQMGQEATSQMTQQMIGDVIAAPLGLIRRGGFVPKTAEVLKTVAEDKALGTRLSGPELASGTRLGNIGKIIQSYSAGAFEGGQMQREVREQGTKAAFTALDDTLDYLGHLPVGAEGPEHKAARGVIGKAMEAAAEKAPAVDMRPVKTFALQELEKNVVPRLGTFPDTVKNAQLAKLLRAVKADPTLVQRLPRPAVTRLTDALLEKYKGDPVLQMVREVLGADDDANFQGVWGQFKNLRKKGTPLDRLYAKDDAQRFASALKGQFRRQMDAASPEFKQANEAYRDLVRGDFIREKLILGGKPAPKTEEDANAILTTMAKRLRVQGERGTLARAFKDPEGQQIIQNLQTVAHLMEKRTAPMAGNLRKIFEIGRLMSIPAGMVMGQGVKSSTLTTAALWEGFPDFFTWVIHDPKATQWFVEGVRAPDPQTSTAAIVRLMDLYRRTLPTKNPNPTGPSQ